MLLRESFREGGKVRKRTLANLSSLFLHQVDAIRRALKGEKLVPVTELFETIRSPHRGHVQAVVTAMKKLGFESLVGSRPCCERDLIVAMVTARILEPDSKLATRTPMQMSSTQPWIGSRCVRSTSRKNSPPGTSRRAVSCSMT